MTLTERLAYRYRLAAMIVKVPLLRTDAVSGYYDGLPMSYRITPSALRRRLTKATARIRRLDTQRRLPWGALGPLTHRLYREVMA